MLIFIKRLNEHFNMVKNLETKFGFSAIICFWVMMISHTYTENSYLKRDFSVSRNLETDNSKKHFVNSTQK